jgi:8-oxo-dGTP diphosphatase
MCILSTERIERARPVKIEKSGRAVEVACAVIQDGDRISAFKRPPQGLMPGKWEFPGGKLEPGESAEACLRRELAEELALEVEVVSALEPCRHDYPDFSVLLLPFVCKVAGGAPVLLEHTEIRCDHPESLRGLDWAAADVPVLEAYISAMRRKK